MTKTISVIGLGYVGLPVACAFAAKYPVLGFDINERRVDELRRGVDRTGEVAAAALAAANLRFSAEADDLRQADFHIIAVPTPVDRNKRPDLRPLLRASETVGARLKAGDIVVYESTVYPGATEEECIPVLQRCSGLTAGRDFSVGYSPERINPGDLQHGFSKIQKVVAAQTPAALEAIAAVYKSVVAAGVYPAPAIRVAEAAKVIENVQRDVNIALMNELALIFERMDIDTLDVLAAARTKWNFLDFAPGLVGGHCIGVDPYYLTQKAMQLDYAPQVILAGRSINDNMGREVAGRVIRALNRSGRAGADSVATIMGITFKENLPDIRNTRVIDIVRELERYGVTTQVYDPVADGREVEREYGVVLRAAADLAKADAVIVAVAHRVFVDAGWGGVLELLHDDGLVFDVKGVLPRADKPRSARLYRL